VEAELPVLDTQQVDTRPVKAHAVSLTLKLQFDGDQSPFCMKRSVRVMAKVPFDTCIIPPSMAPTAAIVEMSGKNSRPTVELCLAVQTPI
jgi:hypothetical protein